MNMEFLTFPGINNQIPLPPKKFLEFVQIPRPTLARLGALGVSATVHGAKGSFNRQYWHAGKGMTNPR